jgi:hypothetical protein
MTELELYKFCQDKEIEWRGEKLILWIEPDDLSEFADLLGVNYLCEGGLGVYLLTEGTIAVELNDIQSDFDIDLEHILSKEAAT